MSGERTVAELLAALAAVMAERGLRWYLFGAQAAIIWGSPRLSADADITAQLQPEEIEPFLEAMRRHGFEAAISDSYFVERTRVLAFVHQIRSILGLLEEALSRSDLLPEFEKSWRDA